VSRGARRRIRALIDDAAGDVEACQRLIAQLTEEGAIDGVILMTQRESIAWSWWLASGQAMGET